MAPVTCRHLLAQVIETRESVQDFQVRVRIKKRLLVALPVYVYKERPDLAQQRKRGELMIDEDSVSARRALAADEQFALPGITCHNASVLEQMIQLRVRADG